ALAEFLAANHPAVVGPDGPNDYMQAETDPSGDLRIQNLSARSDTVLDGAVYPGPELAINEIRIDQPSTDDDEYFELIGTPGLALDDFSYIVIGDGTGGSGVVENVTSLAGQTLDVDGFFLAAESTFSLATADLITTLDFENSDNVTHLLVRDFTGALGDDLDTDDDGVLDTTPWSEIVDSVALVETPATGDQYYSTTTVGPDGSFVPGHAYRLPDGTRAWQIGPFDVAGGDDTPGAPNAASSGPVDLAIYEIQGADHRSPYEGSAVRTTGIVTAVASNGFYMQDAVGDGSDVTSDGIFVYSGSAPGVAVGDEVEVEGGVSEYQGGTGTLTVTEIVGPSVTVMSSGNALPSAVLLGVDRIQPDSVIDDDGLTSFDPATDSIDFLESLEGMLVEVNDPLVISGTNRFGEVGLAANRGGEAGSGILNATVSAGDFNPEILLTDDNLVSAPAAVTGDGFASNPVGVMDYTFGYYKLELTSTPTVISGGRTPEVTALAGDSTHVTVATFNVLNLDPSDGDPGGAPDQLDSIAGVIVTNLGAPDILALEEIQDNSGPTDDGVTSASDTLTELIDAIALAGGPTYAFAEIPPVDNADGGQPGANIREAFLYNTARVSLDAGSLYRIETDAFDAGGDGTLAEAAYEGTRKPLVGTFTFLPTGDEVTVIGNHLKSKSQDDGLYGENQPPVEVTLAQRVDQATAVHDEVSDILALDPTANIVVLGDLNDFQFSDTLAALANADGGTAELTSLTDLLLAGEDQYSFIFNGNSQQLDHILVSDNIVANAPAVDIVHSNLDFGFPANYPSDHDPIVAMIDLSDPLPIT
ncbi:MAG: endonuclease/exonuclease/phosphatase family protein, partial [Rhodobiaceae bacterium]|nr:endonuclease/exonuclease/phosphatase family protein [Rhodobiaceae bacterium]